MPHIHIQLETIPHLAQPWDHVALLKIVLLFLSPPETWNFKASWKTVVGRSEAGMQIRTLILPLYYERNEFVSSLGCKVLCKFLNDIKRDYDQIPPLPC